MIHPSYSELIEAINANNEDNDNTMLVNSRYSLVLATSKRARQIIAGSEPLVGGAAGKKPLSVAIDELYKGKVKILENTPAQDESEEMLSAEEMQETGSAKDVEEESRGTSEETTQDYIKTGKGCIFFAAFTHIRR